MDVNAVVAIAQQAGVLAEKLQSDLTVTRKQDNSMLTQADLEVSKFIIKELTALFPEDVVFTEEHQREVDWTGRVWVVDPIDGTSNYAKGEDGWAISIGLVEKSQPLFGLILAPRMNMIAWAEKGRGAYLNKERIAVTKTSDMNSASAYVTLTQNRRKIVHQLKEPEEHPYSAVLKLVFVAAGKADAYVHLRNRLHKWDTAAGHIILEEAGGKISSVTGQALDYTQEGTRWQTGVIASNGALQTDLTTLFSSETARSSKTPSQTNTTDTPR